MTVSIGIATAKGDFGKEGAANILRLAERIYKGEKGRPQPSYRRLDGLVKPHRPHVLHHAGKRQLGVARGVVEKNGETSGSTQGRRRATRRRP